MVLDVLLLGEPDAPSPAITTMPRRPAGPLRGRLDHRPGPRVLKMPQPELDGVRAGRLGKLVHEGLDRKDVGVGPQSPRRRTDPRHALYHVLHGGAQREGVHGSHVAGHTYGA